MGKIPKEKNLQVKIDYIVAVGKKVMILDRAVSVVMESRGMI